MREILRERERERERGVYIITIACAHPQLLRACQTYLNRPPGIVVGTEAGDAACEQAPHALVVHDCPKGGEGTTPTNSVVQLNHAHAVSHGICGLCVPTRQCPVVSLSLRHKRG